MVEVLLSSFDEPLLVAEAMILVVVLECFSFLRDDDDENTDAKDIEFNAVAVVDDFIPNTITPVETVIKAINLLVVKHIS